MSKRRPVFANTKHLTRERAQRRKRFRRTVLIVFLASIPVAGWICFWIFAF